MTSTTHALIGALFAAKFQNPYLAIGLSLASHYPMDIIPHWDFGTNMQKRSKVKTTTFALVDIGIGLVAGYFLYSALAKDPDFLVLFIAIFAAQLPDWAASPYYLLGWKFPPFGWIEDFSNIFHVVLKAPWGMVTQAAAVLVVYGILFILF